MRIVLIGVSHWHTPFYLDPALALADVTVAGVSDPDPARAEPVAAQAGCPAFADYREMCATLRPDFAFALGRHCDMPDEARFLIDARIPFAMEKPCGISSADVHDIAGRAAAAGVFAAVPFVLRYSPLIETVREIAAGEAVHYLAFKFIGGMVDRYRQQGVAWMLDRTTAGGGPLLNLGVHHLDLCRVLLGNAALEVVGAAISNHTAQLDIEDHAMVLLRGGGAACSVETGYLYPAPNSVFDMHYSIRTDNHYFAARDDSMLEIVDSARNRTTRAMKLTNVFFYPAFVHDTLRRLRDGRPPIADLHDMAAAMDLVQAAYHHAPLGARGGGRTIVARSAAAQPAPVSGARKPHHEEDCLGRCSPRDDGAARLRRSLLRPTLSRSMEGPAMTTEIGTRIDIVSDAICPWCYIGRAQLQRALASLANEGLHFSVHWNPFQLNPDMPKEGRDRATYRAMKFGSAERSAAADARVAEAGASVGLSIRHDLMLRTPNTLDAHRLVWFGGEKGAQDAVMQAIFAAYFTEGRDIGDRAVLADCAGQAGLDREEAAQFLAGDLAAREMLAADQAAREAGVNGVPSFFLDGYSLFSGAMPAESMADAFRKANAILRQRAAA